MLAPTTAASAAMFVSTSVLGHQEGLAKYEERYLDVRADFKDEFGQQEAGRNIVLDGDIGKQGELTVPSPDRVKDSTAYMYGALHPPEPEVTYASASSSSYSGGGGLPECTYGPESGGDYSAYNPSSGATGKYQIIPSTAAAYGCDLSTEGGQDACAAEIYADVGGSAWVNC